MSEVPRVTVAGGGLAGLTAALRLAERGYQVKLYEQKSMLGGDLASRPAAYGVELDVYPHMYLPWYHNFWRLLSDATGDDRAERFLPLSGVRQLRREEYPRFTGITDMYSPRRVLQNLFSGWGPPADLLVFGYASLDLLAERLNPTMSLDNVSMTGFLNARPYMTERAAAACDHFITIVWAIPAYLTAADDYRTFLEYSLAEPEPAFWLARGPAARQVIEPLTAALEAAGVEIVRSVQVTSVSCSDGRATEIGLQDSRLDAESHTWVAAGDGWTEEVDELVLAVPPGALLSLVRTGKRGHRIVERAPRLAELSRLRTQPIPILNLCFTRKLRRIPVEPVGLFDSRLALAFTDISQTWQGVTEFAGKTVLAVSASDAYGLPGTGPHDDALAMLRELAKYLDFDPGTKWGESSDIDWERTRYEPNTDAQLFVNETGTDVWRPAAACDGVSNLYFAGDFCANRIGMTTIESAVTTGLEAARVIVERRGLGAPVEIADPDPGVAALYAWLRYAWAPYAFAAKAWSTGSDWIRSLKDLLTPAGPPGQRRGS
jgi:phytoene dehydrogenase-like protein